jgi:hypothetical protein
MEYYTYAYLREDRTPYYIGKGKGNRAYRKDGREIKLPKDKSRIIFLKQNLTEGEAFKHEVYMIAILGRKNLGTGMLWNLTNGGEGVSGLIHKDETKINHSKLLTGRKLTEEHKRKISEATKGKNNPNYGKLGENHPYYGKKRSEEHKRKISQAMKGKTFSEEHKAKLSEKKQNIKWWNDGQISKMSVECPGDSWVSGRIMKTMKKFKSNE